jgi:hypothetical protein
MSEAQANGESDSEVEIRLTFEDHTYSLNEFVETIDGIEAAVFLAAANAVGLEAGMQIGGPPVLQEETISQWYDIQRVNVASQIVVQKVSLNSPMDIVIWVSTVSGISGAIVAMLRGWIYLNNDLHVNRGLRAKTDAQEAAYQFLGDALAGRIPPEQVVQVTDNPLLKKALHQAAKTIGKIENIEIKAKHTDPDVK